jgi:hypothetical protein
MNDETAPDNVDASQGSVNRWTLARCLLTATSVEFLLRTASLPRVCRLLRVGFSPLQMASSPANSVELLPSVRRVARHVDYVYRRFPLPDTCLRRALVAGRLLTEHRPELVLGVRTAPHFEAHAWLTVAGGILDWSYRHAEFRRL